MKHLKMLGLAAIAALSLTAFVGVSSASAFTMFTSEAETTTVKASQTETAEFTTSAGTIKCTGGSFEGTQKGVFNSGTNSYTAETLETNLNYSGCTFLSIFGVTVKPHNCHYKFHAGGTVDIVNCGTEFIEFEAVGCNVKIGNQNGLSTIGYENTGTGTGRSVIVKPNVTGITYTTNSSCPGGAGTKSNGEYHHGNAKAVGSSGKTAVGIWVS